MRVAIRAAILCVIFVIHGQAGDIDLEVHNGLMLNMLREMTNSTNAAESLNLPANASSIRENITDTFSCENRTYGYYADVDNECQIFHVCLPSQTPSGRNVTYKWSFICPNETIFNQEVLVCTRPRDSIPCEDSPDYYDLNMEIGKIYPEKEPKKIVNESNEIDNNKLQTNEKQKNQHNQLNNERERNQNNYNNERDRYINQKRRPDHRKQNIIMGELFKEVVDDEMKEELQTMDLDENVEEIFPDLITEEIPLENEPEVGYNKEDISTDGAGERLVLERSMGLNSNSRKSFRFRADA